MVTVISLNKSNKVRKSNALVEARYRLSANEQKFVITMISLISPKDTDFTLYRMKAKELIKEIGLEKNKRAYQDLRKIVSGLMDKKLLIRKENSFLETRWVASAEYIDNGIVEFEFSQKLKPFLLQLKDRFTQYEKRFIISLKSSYSIRIYELLKEFEGIHQRTMFIDDIKKELQIEDKYPVFADFRKKVLEPAKREIPEKTDIHFDYEPIRENRKFVKIKFTIRKRQTEKLLQENREAEEIKKSLLEAGLSKVDANKIFKEQWEYLDQDYKEEAKSSGKSFEVYIKEKLAYYKKKKELGDIKKTGTGFLITAIRKNFVDTGLLEKIKKEKKAKIKEMINYQERKLTELKHRASEESRKLSDKILQEDPETIMEIIKGIKQDGDLFESDKIDLSKGPQVNYKIGFVSSHVTIRLKKRNPELFRAIDIKYEVEEAETLKTLEKLKNQL